MIIIIQCKVILTFFEIDITRLSLWYDKRVIKFGHVALFWKVSVQLYYTILYYTIIKFCIHKVDHNQPLMLKFLHRNQHHYMGNKVGKVE